MPLVINATEETVTVQAAGTYFTFGPGKEKTIRSPEICNFILSDRKGFGLAVLPDLVSEVEEQDGEISNEEIEARREARKEQKKAACSLALRDYVARQREIIKNNQVSLARDLARADYKYGAEHEMSDGEMQAMELVAKYESKGKDAAQERLDRIEKLKKQIDTK